MKLFIVGPHNNGDGLYSLLTEDGELLASHFCSRAAFAFADLEGRRPERREKWRERFGAYEIALLTQQAEMTRAELLARNKRWFESVPAEEKETVNA